MSRPEPPTPPTPRELPAREASAGPSWFASLFRSQGRLYEAEPLLQEAAATAREVLGDSHPHTKIFEKGLSAVQTQTQTHRARETAREQRGQQPTYRARDLATSHRIYTQPTELEGQTARRQQLKPR